MVDLWKWFSNTENLKVLSGLAAIATIFGVLWKVYTHFFKRPKAIQEHSGYGIQVGRNFILIGKNIIISNEDVKEIYEGKEIEKEETDSLIPSRQESPKGKLDHLKKNPRIRNKPRMK